MHLRAGWGRGGLIAGVVLLVLTVLPSVRTGHQLPYVVEEAVLDAPLSSVADLAKISPAELEHRLRARGLSAPLDLTVCQAAARNDVSEDRILTLAFLRH
jgi:hypothetical protein